MIFHDDLFDYVFGWWTQLLLTAASRVPESSLFIVSMSSDCRYDALTGLEAVQWQTGDISECRLRAGRCLVGGTFNTELRKG